MENKISTILLLNNAVNRLNEKNEFMEKMYLNCAQGDAIIEATYNVVAQLDAIIQTAQIAKMMVKARYAEYYRMTDV